MSNVNLNIMYKFLATFGGNGKGWEEVADADNNQAITYGEFDKFTMSNQDDIFSQGNEDCDTVDELKDLINAFWNTVDTKRTGYVGKTDVRNKFALDDNEMKNIERNVERYNILSNFINNQTQPSFLSGNYGKIWKEMLEEKLGALLEASNLSGDELKNYLAQEYPRIAQECTAECSKMQYMDQLVKGDLFDDYREYYQYGSDETLNNLIQSYIEGLTEIKSPEEINNDIKAIINAYLAQAGINVEGDSLYNLEALGYQANVLNDLQKAVLMPEMIEALWTNEYEGYEDQFNKAVEKFIDEMGKNGESFDSIKSMLEDVDSLSEAFNNSNAKQSLDALIHYSNFNNSGIEEDNNDDNENPGYTIPGNLTLNGAQPITPGTNKPTGIQPGTLGTTIPPISTGTTVPSPNRTQITHYAEGSFLRAAENLFGYSIAHALDINNIENHPIYQNIISEVCSRIESGEWRYPEDKAKIDAYILTQ
ncbi:hypothetical protein J6R97_05980, partial [bacterium]|nr:hypothetical protein [bacterium]